MRNFYTRFLSGLFLILLAGINANLSADTKITGNTLLLYELTKEDGKWLGESEQRLNLSMGGRTGLENLLSFNLGLVRRDNKLEYLGGLLPTYALNLRGKRYSLASGYSINFRRDIINSRLYQDVALSPAKLPAFRLTYSKQGTKDTQENRSVDSTNFRLGLEGNWAVSYHS